MLVAFLAISWTGIGQEEDAYAVKLDGRKTWTLRYGLGDPTGLAASGGAPGQIFLDQTLAVDITGEALSILRIEAHFDDQVADTLQSLSLYLDTDRLDGVLGDFTSAGVGGFATYGKKMTGLQLEYTLGDALITATASKLEGISASKTFVGEKASDQVVFAATTDEQPPRPRPYKRSIEGLYAYPLEVYYVQEFSEVVFSFDISEGLRADLAQYGLSYLPEVLAEEPNLPLDEWEFEVVGDDVQVLLLSQPANDLVRARLKDAIARYNEINDLPADQAKQYPFAAGTQYELQFLETIGQHAAVQVDDERHPVLDAVRHRYYDLGRDGIVPPSLAVEVSVGGMPFEPISDPALDDYRVELLANTGVLEVDFPEAFFTEDSAIRVSFDYTVTGGVFMLGLSIIPGSERVTLNDELLEPEDDYMVDYEIGMLILLVEIDENDVLRVEYERFSGGVFGSATDYATYFYGASVDWPISDELILQGSLLHTEEDPGSVADPTTVKTMPNRHTVAGVSALVNTDDFTADLFVAYSRDRFPFDDNARIHQRNEIATIATADGIMFFGHRAGLTVLDDGAWTTYGTPHGLTGRSVQALAAIGNRLLIGTHAGLSVVRLQGSSPLNRVANWTSIYAGEGEGLPSGSVTALWIDDEGVVWIGTDVGLASVPIEEVKTPEAWTRPDEGLELGVVRALVGDGRGALAVGTSSGVHRYDPQVDQWETVSGTEGMQVHDLTVVDGMLYVASDRGLRGYRDGTSTGWLVLGEPVYAVGTVGDRLVYGTDDGLIDAEDGTPWIEHAVVTAIGGAGERGWIGTRADADYDLTVFAVDEETVSYGMDTTGIPGRDPFRYVDADPAGHTWEGFIQRATFQHRGDGFSLSGSFENDTPSYRGIGSRSRTDSTGWDVTAGWELGDEADVSIAHRYDVSGRLTGAAQSSMSNDLSLQWSFGPVLTVDGHLSTVNDDSRHRGAETRESSYRFSLHDEFFVDRLDVTLSWSDGTSWDHRYGRLYRKTRLAMSANAALLPSWTTGLDWSRPVRREDNELSGSERLTARTDWSGEALGAGIDADYVLGWRRAIPNGRSQRDHELEVDVDGAAFDLLQWTITPGARFGATSDETTLDLDGRLTARGRRGDVSLQATLRGGLSGLGEPVVRESEKLSLTGSYAGLESLRPSITYSVDRSVAVYGTRRQETIAHALSGRMTWTPGAVHEDELSVTLNVKGAGSERRTTARLQNSYRLDLGRWVEDWWDEGEGGSPYPAVNLRIDTDLDYRRSADEREIDATTSASWNVALSPTWSGRLGASFLAGTRSDGAFYHSLLLELTAAIDF